MIRLIALVALLACAPYVSPEIRRQAASMPVLSSAEIGGRKYEILAEVHGRSCAGRGAAPNIHVAREELKVAAARLNAQAIVSVLCLERSGTLQLCSGDAIECRGDAIRWAS